MTVDQNFESKFLGTPIQYKSPNNITKHNNKQHKHEE